MLPVTRRKYVLRNFFQGHGTWPARGQNTSKSYATRITVRNMEVFEQRNKHYKPCTTGLPHDDDKTIEWIINKVGCKPPFWKHVSQLPLCTSWEELQQGKDLILSTMQKNPNYTEVKPCRGLEKIQFDSIDIEAVIDYETPVIEFRIVFPEFSYKEVRNVRSMDEQTLIGKTTFITVEKVSVKY